MVATSNPFCFSGFPYTAELSRLLLDIWAAYCENASLCGLTPYEPDQYPGSMTRVWASSQYVAEQCSRNPAMFHRLVDSGCLVQSKSVVVAEIPSAIEFDDESGLMKWLREFRNEHMVRIAWRDIAGVTDIDTTLKDLSLLAEVCLQKALDFVFRKACERYGIPRGIDGEVQWPVILGMGKLGAWELNFSSDIDLIFAFENDGILEGRRSRTYAEFYTAVVQSLIRVIDTVTAEGFVFRVDTRLRPFGDSGPLVMNFSAMENYYQVHAREWERYALIKVRPVAGDLVAGDRLCAFLKPFVYRRYIDYGAFAELRQLKSRISVELKRKDREDNIKLGPGGIREIEFIGQAFQLIRGGKNPELQQRGILQTLETLKTEALLPGAIVDRLVDAYRFLRIVENRLQQYLDQQVHDIPSSPGVRDRLVLGLGFDSWDTASGEIERVRVQVHEIFDQVFVSPQSGTVHGEIDRVWTGDEDPGRLEALLTEAGYGDSARTLKEIHGFRNSLAIRTISNRGAVCLDSLVPMLIGACAAAVEPDQALVRLLKLIEAVAGRPIYLSLLLENPLAVSQLVKLASASSWVVAFISRHPLLLDELLDVRRLYAPLSLEELGRELEQRVSGAGETDLERYMSEMREFRQAQVLRVASADIMEAIPVSTVSDYLTEIAEVVVRSVMARAWVLVAEKHGVPPGCSIDQPCGFGVVGYGKFGGIELGYGSDLDLVFLYGGVAADALTDGRRPITSVEFFGRVGRRLVNLLDTKMLSGILYEVDMRLRPSGSSGLLVSHVDAFEKYQRTSAWTWEHQALVRARYICGAPQVGERFSVIRRDVICLPRDVAPLRAEVVKMREKMRDALGGDPSTGFNLKQGVGGIVDIEFIVQFGVLLHAESHPELVEFSDTVRLLGILQQVGFLGGDEAEMLRGAYFCYRNRGHRAALQERSAVVPGNEFSDLRGQVASIWRRIMG